MDSVWKFRKVLTESPSSLSSNVAFPSPVTHQPCRNVRLPPFEAELARAQKVAAWSPEGSEGSQGQSERGTTRDSGIF